MLKFDLPPIPRVFYKHIWKWVVNRCECLVANCYNLPIVLSEDIWYFPHSIFSPQPLRLHHSSNNPCSIFSCARITVPNWPR